jgi:hypothetical protein
MTAGAGYTLGHQCERTDQRRNGELNAGSKGQLARAMNMEFLLEIPRFFVYAALIVWGVTFVGLLKSFISAFSPVHNADHG